MPTVLLIAGWRFFFYSNESNEPIHIHAQKAEMECKYWIDEENYDLKEAFTFNMGTKDKRDVKKIIFSNFEYIVDQWNLFKSK
jgi:hypothetical protein